MLQFTALLSRLMKAFLQLTTPQEMSRMKHQMKLRSDLKWAEMKWSVAKDLQPSDIEIVQARVLALRPEVICRCLSSFHLLTSRALL